MMNTKVVKYYFCFMAFFFAAALVGIGVENYFKYKSVVVKEKILQRLQKIEQTLEMENSDD